MMDILITKMKFIYLKESLSKHGIKVGSALITKHIKEPKDP